MTDTASAKIPLNTARGRYLPTVACLTMPSLSSSPWTPGGQAHPADQITEISVLIWGRPRRRDRHRQESPDVAGRLLKFQ